MFVVVALLSYVMSLPVVPIAQAPRALYRSLRLSSAMPGPFWTVVVWKGDYEEDAIRVCTSPNYATKGGELLCRHHRVYSDYEMQFHDWFLSPGKIWEDITPTSGLWTPPFVPPDYMLLYVCESYDGGIDLYVHMPMHDAPGYYRVYHSSWVQRDRYWSMDHDSLSYRGYRYYEAQTLHWRSPDGAIKGVPPSRM